MYKFPAIRGIQANREYYAAMVPLRMIPIIFPADDGDYVQPEYRAQRRLNETRVPIISKYILDNRDNYVFSALAASIDGKCTFVNEKNNECCGELQIDGDAKFLINDGQHRKAAILEALRVDPSLAQESITVVFFHDDGLEKSQQIFTDLNKNAVRTSNSISELYDSRDPLAVITRSVIKDVDFLNDYTDKEKDILGKYSSKLFTLNTFYTANKNALARCKMTDSCQPFLVSYWECVVQNMQQWQELRNNQISKKDLREKYIAVQAIVIQALGRLANYYIIEDRPFEDDLKKLTRVDWGRNAKCWKGRAIDQRGRIISNQKAAILICNYLKKRIGIKLTEDERFSEIEMISNQ